VFTAHSTRYDRDASASAFVAGGFITHFRFTPGSTGSFAAVSLRAAFRYPLVKPTHDRAESFIFRFGNAHGICLPFAVFPVRGSRPSRPFIPTCRYPNHSAPLIFTGTGRKSKTPSRRREEATRLRNNSTGFWVVCRKQAEPACSSEQPTNPAMGFVSSLRISDARKRYVSLGTPSDQELIARTANHRRRDVGSIRSWV